MRFKCNSQSENGKYDIKPLKFRDELLRVKYNTQISQLINFSEQKKFKNMYNYCS